MSTPPIAPCPTPSSKRRHKRRGEQCGICDNTPNRASKAPCGTPEAKARHRRRGETCPNCPPHTPKLAECGTQNARRRHRRNNQTCTTCDEKTSDRAANNSKTAFIEEVIFLLNAGEGTARILEATGYTGREKQFRDRLQKHGHHELADRVTKPWDLAA